MKDTEKMSERHYFYAALMFYTRLPVPSNSKHSEQILNRSRKYFPLIGTIIGLIAIITYLASNLFFPIALSVAFSMLASIMATGAFHEDGFADSCDGLGGGWSTEQVLTIMKDSRVGTYAVVGLLAILGIKFLSLYEIAQSDLATFIFIYIIAHTTSRQYSSMVIERYDYVQDIDASKVKPITDKQLVLSDRRLSFISTLIPIGIFFLFFSLASTASLIIALVGAYSVSRLFSAYCKQRIGGYTGDILGAVQQLSEVSFYLIFIAAS